MAVFEDVRDVVVEQLSVDPQAVKLVVKLLKKFYMLMAFTMLTSLKAKVS